MVTSAGLPIWGGWRPRRTSGKDGGGRKGRRKHRPVLITKQVRLDPGCTCMVLAHRSSACVAGVHTPVKPVCGRHVVGTVVL